MSCLFLLLKYSNLLNDSKISDFFFSFFCCFVFFFKLLCRGNSSSHLCRFIAFLLHLMKSKRTEKKKTWRGTFICSEYMVRGTTYTETHMHIHTRTNNKCFSSIQCCWFSVSKFSLSCSCDLSMRIFNPIENTKTHTQDDYSHYNYYSYSCCYCYTQTDTPVLEYLTYNGWFRWTALVSKGKYVKFMNAFVRWTLFIENLNSRKG